MECFFVHALLIAKVGDKEISFWIQILVFLLVAVCWGVYSIVKNNRNRHKERQQKLAEEGCDRYSKSRWRFQLKDEPVAPRKSIVEEYLAKVEKIRRDISNLSQEPKLDFDSPGTAGEKNPVN